MAAAFEAAYIVSDVAHTFAAMKNRPCYVSHINTLRAMQHHVHSISNPSNSHHSRPLAPSQTSREIAFETVNVTGGGKLHGRLAETSADVVFAHEHHWLSDRFGAERCKFL